MKHLPALVTLATALVAGLPATAAPLSNQQFSDQVRQLRQQMASTPATVERAAVFCTNLPEHRSVEEPQCVALRLHLRSQIVARSEAPSELCLPSGIGRLISRITGAA